MYLIMSAEGRAWIVSAGRLLKGADVDDWPRVSRASIEKTSEGLEEDENLRMTGMKKEEEEERMQDKSTTPGQSEVGNGW